MEQREGIQLGDCATEARLCKSLKHGRDLENDSISPEIDGSSKTYGRYGYANYPKASNVKNAWKTYQMRSTRKSIANRLAEIRDAGIRSYLHFPTY